jgi:hypothetical protein
MGEEGAEMARLDKDGKRHWLGQYDTEAEAINARLRKQAMVEGRLVEWVLRNCEEDGFRDGLRDLLAAHEAS